VGWLGMQYAGEPKCRLLWPLYFDVSFILGCVILGLVLFSLRKERARAVTPNLSVMVSNFDFDSARHCHDFFGVLQEVFTVRRE